METKEILAAIASAITDLMNTKHCSIDMSIAVPFAHALSSMGICICGGAYDEETNQKWFYLENI